MTREPNKVELDCWRYWLRHNDSNQANFRQSKLWVDPDVPGCVMGPPGWTVTATPAFLESLAAHATMV
jgi:hypothetical protein